MQKVIRDSMLNGIGLNLNFKLRMKTTQINKNQEFRINPAQSVIDRQSQLKKTRTK